jgi:hypothetical protein
MNLRSKLACGCGVTLVLAGYVGCPAVLRPRPRSGPDDIEALVERAEARGLHACYVHGPASVTLSVKPLTAEQANALHLGLPPGAWAGAARVYRSSLRTSRGVDLETYPGLARTEFGSAVVIGDPEVVKMLMGGPGP